MKSEKLKKIGAVLLSVSITLAIYTATLAIYMYAKGWRVDLLDQSFRKVGVLTIESSPTQANIYVDDELIGRGSRSTTLDIGTYRVMVTREGYFDWNKEVNILEEKATPIFPFLIRAESEKKSIFRSNYSLENTWVDENNNYLFLLLKNDTTYQLLRYRINSGFWDFGSNPSIVFTLEEEESLIFSDIELLLSPTGELALLEITTNNTSPSRYIIQTNRTLEYESIVENPLRLQDFEDYKINWDSTDQYLILESDNDVISYDISKSTKHLLMRKLNPLDRWSTDQQGFFYVFKHLGTDDNNVLEYSILQYLLDGSARITVLPSVFFQNNTEYIERYREEGIDFTYFTNYPECTQSIGEVLSFEVNKGAKGLYIKTTEATYWYDMDTKKYLTILPYPADIVEFSPDGNRVLINGSNNYKVFTFNKQDGDHTTSIGTKVIENINVERIEKINWLSNSSYFQFEEDAMIYIIDKDGDNKTPIVDTSTIDYWIITNSNEELVTLDRGQNGGVEIIVYTIH